MALRLAAVVRLCGGAVSVNIHHSLDTSGNLDFKWARHIAAFFLLQYSHFHRLQRNRTATASLGPMDIHATRV